MSDLPLSVPGIVHVGPPDPERRALVQLGPAAGWLAPQGIRSWSREVSVAFKGDVAQALRTELGVVLPEEQVDASKAPRAQKAAQSCTLVAVEGDLADKLVAKGVRVHTVGYDRITGGFYYIARGGAGTPVSAQSDLIEMI